MILEMACVILKMACVILKMISGHLKNDLRSFPNVPRRRRKII